MPTNQPYRRNYNKKSENKPVKKAMTKYGPPPKKPAPKYQVYNNKNAIATLARQVKTLQLGKLGNFQKRCEKMNIVSATENFNRTYPICFCMNQFNDANNLHAQAYKVDSTSGAAVFMKRFEPQSSQVIYGSVPGPYTKYNPHWGSNDDTPSTEIYQPLGTKVRIQFEFENVLTTEEPKWLRVDIVRPKKQYTMTATHDLTLPVGLLQFSNIARGDVLERNWINPQLWTVKTKWLKLWNNSSATKDLKGIITINSSYKNDKPIKPDYNSTTGATFLTNVPYMQKEWCIISCGDSAPTTIDIQRFTSWRDQHGVAA